MILIDLSIFFMIVDYVAAEIFFKGDCLPIDDLDNRNDSPDWSPCMAFRNVTWKESNACGKDLRISPVKIYEHREFGYSQWGLQDSKHANSLSPCNVTCGEGFQYRNITRSESCTAIQYRSCWVGKCLTKNQCLNLFQRSQKQYLTRQYSVNKYCAHWQFTEYMQIGSRPNIRMGEEVERLEEKSQIDDEGGCKQNITDSCKWAYRDFLRLQLDIMDNEDLKTCYYQTMEKKIFNTRNNFFTFVKGPNDDVSKTFFDRANKSCKFF